MAETWTEWEQPWTRATGVLREYRPLVGPLAVGQTVAVRSKAKPYLPTFAPWWHNLVIASIDGDEVRFENAPRFVAKVDQYPLDTHWATTHIGGKTSCRLEPHTSGLVYDANRDVMTCPLCGHEQHEEMGG